MSYIEKFTFLSNKGVKNVSKESLKERRERALREHKQRYLSRKANVGVIRKIWAYARPYRGYMYLTFLFDLINSIFELLVPIYLGFAINYCVGVGAVDFILVTKNLAIMLLFVMLASLFNWLGNLTINAYAYKTAYALRDRFFKKINTVPFNFIDNNSHGDLLSRMVNDIDLVCDGFLQSVAAVISGLFTVVGTIIAMYLLNFKMATVILILTPMSVIIAWYIVKKSKKYFKMTVQTQGEISGYIEEYVGGSRVVKAFSYEKNSISNFDKINQQLYFVGEKSQFYGNLSNPTTRLINGIVYAVVGLVGALLILAGEPGFTIGTITSFLTYANTFGRPFNEISSEISDIQTAFAAAARVLSVLETEDEPTDALLPELTSTNGEITIKDVNFSYLPKVKLIENFNLHVNPGEKIAIVGPTGCGKTTLINLLMRFYDVNGGAIMIDDKNISEITRNSLRNKYGMVLQDTWLFEDTVKNNIAYGNHNIALDDVIEAAKLAGVHDFIMKMANGYDTVITEGGANLSQGEKQLLCIARIILIKPQMLILDEATSNIDTRTELKIQHVFDEIMKGKTTFIVAHRLSTITSADKILVMNKGNIIEQGTHKELLEKKGFYYELYNSQFSTPTSTSD